MSLGSMFLHTMWEDKVKATSCKVGNYLLLYHFRSMIRENRQLVTNEPVEFKK